MLNARSWRELWLGEEDDWRVEGKLKKSYYASKAWHTTGHVPWTDDDLHRLLDTCDLRKILWLWRHTAFEELLPVWDAGNILYLWCCRLARPKGEKEVMKNRFKRVYVPYFKYAFFSIIVFWTYEYFHYHIFPLSSFKQIVWGVLGIELPGVYHSYHLWFILPYFIISILPKQHLNSHLGG